MKRTLLFTLILLFTPAFAQDDERPRELNESERRRSVKKPIWNEPQCMKPGSKTYPCKTRMEKPKWAEEERTSSLFAVRNTSDAVWIGLMALGVLGALALWVLDRKRNS